MAMEIELVKEAWHYDEDGDYKTFIFRIVDEDEQEHDVKVYIGVAYYGEEVEGEDGELEIKEYPHVFVIWNGVYDYDDFADGTTERDIKRMINRLIDRYPEFREYREDFLWVYRI